MLPAQTAPSVGASHTSMRKGTRSCYECRKRKVRCIFAKDASICERCVAGDKPCTEQRRELLQAAALETRESLKDRVTRLEAIIREQASGSEGVGMKALQMDGQNAQDSSSKSDSLSSITSHQAPTSSHDLPLLESSQNIDPIVTLFNNAIVSLSSDHRLEIGS